MNYDVHIAAGERTLVEIAGFDIPRHRITFLFGESGIGKSLMSKAVYGLLGDADLDVSVNGEGYSGYLRREEVRDIRRNGFFVFQEPSTHLNPLLTLGAQLREGSLGGMKNEEYILGPLWEGAPPDDLRELLAVYPKPHRPSGGEKQRMLLAMAFKKIDLFLSRGEQGSDALFVFDEPTGSLDNHYRNLFLSLLFERFRRQPFSVLLITHDYSMVGEVTARHRNLLSSVSFKEVVKKSAGLQLREFLPETYLGWLGAQSPADIPVEGEPLLTVASGVRVFGRSLSLSHDVAGMEERPLVLHRGTLAYIKAPSGTGKTSLMKAIMGLIPASNLQIRLGSVAVSEKTPRHVWQHEIWGKMITMVFQHADEALNLRATVEETFHGLPVRPEITRDRLEGILRELFDADMIPAFLDAPVATLSGGQKQRVNLLRGLALATGVLVVDEPLNGLDFDSSAKVIALLAQRQRQGSAIVMISHNEEILDPLVRPENVYYLHARR